MAQHFLTKVLMNTSSKDDIPEDGSNILNRKERMEWDRRQHGEEES